MNPAKDSRGRGRVKPGRQDMRIFLRTAAAGMVILLAGCGEDKGTARPAFSLPPVLRWTEPGREPVVDPSLDALCGMGHDLFDTGFETLVDDAFSDPDLWKNMGEKNARSESFESIGLAECADGHALRIRPGVPNKGRILAIPARRNYTASARIKLPPGADLEEVKDFLIVIEVRGHTRPDPETMHITATVDVHQAWRKAGEHGDWIDVFQVFTPKEQTRFIILCFLGSCAGLDRIGEILVDRVMIRPALVAETASAVKVKAVREPSPENTPVALCEAGGEVRASLLAATPGRLAFPVEPGGVRIFRFGLAFPARLSRGHASRIRINADLAEKEREKIPLLQDMVTIDPPSEATSHWIERAVEIPPTDRDAEIILTSESMDEGQALLAFGAPALVAPAVPGGPPNVLLVSIDTLRADRLGAYGGYHPAGVSPFIDRIAAESVRFEKAFSQASYTLPSHVSMLSGQYPTVHGVTDLYGRIDPERTPLLPAILRDAGYLTGAFTGGRLVHHAFGFQEGFDTYFEPDPCWRDHFDRLLAWMENNRRLPFFLFFHTYVVHDYSWNTQAYIERFDPECESTLHPFTTYAGFEEWLKDGRTPTEADLECLENRYAAGIRMADDALHRLVEFLESTGAMENTLLVITSDHGEELLERGRIQHGRTLYEEQIHVPLILRPPGGIAPRTVPDLAEVIDIPPTILDFLGLPLPPGIQGRSLLPFLGPDSAGPGEKPAYSEVEFGVTKYALRSKEWKIILNLDSPEAGDGETVSHEFFHLDGDPDERRDLANRAPEFDAFLKLLDAFRRNLEAVADGMERRAGQGTPLDPGLLEELRAHGYIK